MEKANGNPGGTVMSGYIDWVIALGGMVIVGVVAVVTGFLL
jgi:hypothetical protein